MVPYPARVLTLRWYPHSRALSFGRPRAGLEWSSFWVSRLPVRALMSCLWVFLRSPPPCPLTTYHLLRATYHLLLTTEYLLLTTYYLLLTTYCLLLTTYHLPLTTYYLLLTYYYLLPTTHYLLFTTDYLLLKRETSHAPPPPTPPHPLQVQHGVPCLLACAVVHLSPHIKVRDRTTAVISIIALEVLESYEGAG